MTDPVGSPSASPNRSAWIGPEHERRRAGLRFLGFALVAVGAVLSVMGLSEFLAWFNAPVATPLPFAFDTGDFPKIERPRGPSGFGLISIGSLLLGAGGLALRFGYLGTVGRYVAREIAPVMVEGAHHVATGTQDAVRVVVAAAAAGLRERAAAAPAPASATCAVCGDPHAPEARFCDHCGTSLQETATPCASCGRENAADARFCAACGSALVGKVADPRA